MLAFFRAALFGSLAICAAAAQEAPRKTVWDLTPGAPLTALPDIGEYRGYACGANGGPPRQALAGFADFMRCPVDADGLREVYFEYDDELEYAARAHGDEQGVNLYAGTVERGFPLIVSALFGQDGKLRGVRMVTDSRPDYRRDATEADIARRANAYLFGNAMAARFDIDPEKDCTKLPPSEGENPVGGVFIKLECHKHDPATGFEIKLSSRLLRKPGQSARDPRLTSKLTKGEFESLARLEIWAAGEPTPR